MANDLGDRALTAAFRAVSAGMKAREEAEAEASIERTARGCERPAVSEGGARHG